MILIVQERDAGASGSMEAREPVQEHLQNAVNQDFPIVAVEEAIFYNSQLTMDQDSQAPDIAMDIVAEEAEQSGGPGAAKKTDDSDQKSRTRVRHHTLRLGLSAACFAKLGRADPPFQLTPAALEKWKSASHLSTTCCRIESEIMLRLLTMSPTVGISVRTSDGGEKGMLESD